MDALIVKLFKFEAAHQLPNHQGKCRNLHGHSYRVEVGVHGPVNPERGDSDDGMVIDFSDLSTLFKERIFNRCDHQFLNDVIPVSPTTAENIAQWIVDELNPDLPGLAFVRVWETQTSYAQVGW